jgi:D-amino-acid oxidase
MKGRSVGIVGGGPIGLFCALALTAKAGLKGDRVAIFDRGDPSRTAGMSASAFVDFDWSHPSKPVIDRQKRSLAVYRSLAGTPGTAVSYGPIYVFRRGPRDLESGERHLDASERPTGFDHGTAAETFRINPPVFLKWMREELARRGVLFVVREVKDFAEVKSECGATVIVNASGVGARELCGDLQVVPYRGHCAVVRLPNAPQQVRLVAGEQTWYVASGPDECRIGGTSDEDCWDLNPDPKAVEAIFRRVKTIMPPGFDPEPNLITVTCGLRPRRHGGLRLEVENTGHFEVVHCYGHGGDGFRDGPGCGMEVRNLVLPRVALD